MRKPNGCTVAMETPVIKNGVEISRIDGGVKIAKTERKVSEIFFVVRLK
jgi:hypothetical protein